VAPAQAAASDRAAQPEDEPMRKLKVRVIDTQDDGTKSIVDIDGIGGVIVVVDSVPGMPEWEEARDSAPGTMPAPACLMVGTERALILSLAVALNACKERIGFEGVMAALEIAADMSPDTLLTMGDDGNFTPGVQRG